MVKIKIINFLSHLMIAVQVKASPLAVIISGVSKVVGPQIMFDFVHL